jgi:hypothetical protein
MQFNNSLARIKEMKSNKQINASLKNRCTLFEAGHLER